MASRSVLLVIAGVAFLSGNALSIAQETTTPKKVFSPLDVGDSRAVLQKRFADIEREIGSLRTVKRHEKADSYEKELKRFKAMLAGPYPPPGSREPELHVAGLYEGQKPANVRMRVQGTATVEVTYTGRPIVLVLCSYEPVKWTVQLAKGVELKEVIVGGYHTQEVAGVPENVPKTFRVHEAGSREYFYCYRREVGSYDRMAQITKNLTGLEVTTFQGMYQFAGKPVVVGPESQDWRVEHVLTQMWEFHEEAFRPERERQVAELKRHKFKAIHVVPGERGIRSSCAFGDFTGAGAVAVSLVGLSSYVSQLAIDPSGSIYYGFTEEGIASIDPKTGAVDKIEFDNALPQLSWPSAIAYDSKRGRVLLSTFGGGGHLYAYEPASKKWSVARTPGLSAQALVYEPTEDVLYAINLPHFSEGKFTTISKYNGQGAHLGDIKLSEPIPPGRHLLRCGSVQLVCVGKGQLVILAPPPGDPGSDWPTPPGPSRSYLVDLKTGKILASALQSIDDAKQR